MKAYVCLTTNYQRPLVHGKVTESARNDFFALAESKRFLEAFFLVGD